MVTEDGADAQRAETVGLKRKLTGPPKLLLGRTRTRSVGHEDAATESEPSDLTETPVTVEEDGSCRGRREVKGEAGDDMHRKSSGSGWWRRFSSAVGCTGRQTNKQRLQKKRIRRVQTSSDVGRQQPSLNFQKKFRRFFARAGRSTWSAPNPCEAQQDVQTEPRREEALGPDGGVQNNATDASSETAMISAELSITAKGPEEPSTEPHNTADGSRMTRTAPGGLTVKAESSPENQSFTTENSTGPSIRIELVPPDSTASQEDGESRLTQNQNHLFLLLGFDHSEQQLLRTARSLVRAAMNAAVDQLSREQQNGSERVHREALGCRDHA